MTEENNEIIEKNDNSIEEACKETEEACKETEEACKEAEEACKETEKTNAKKRKKILIIALAVALVVALGLGILAMDKYFKDISEIEFQTNIPMGFGKEATVILLAGQSNAAGCSHDEYLKANVSAEKYAEYEKGYDNVYINYYASATNESHGFVKCAARQGEFGTCFGPELGLAEKLNEMHPDKTFFIIKYAWGGTNLYEQWLSPSSGKEGPLYSSFVEYVNTSIKYLKIKGYNVKIEGMCWMQGEADSMEDGSTLSYEQNLSNFIGDIRAAFAEYAADDGIAFVDAYIAATIFWKNYIQLNQAKQAVADSSPMNVVIDTIAEGLTVTGEPADQPDIAHYDSLSEIKLGHLFAEEISKFL